MLIKILILLTLALASQIVVSASIASEQSKQVSCYGYKINSAKLNFPNNELSSLPGPWGQIPAAAIFVLQISPIQRFPGRFEAFKQRPRPSGLLDFGQKIQRPNGADQPRAHFRAPILDAFDAAHVWPSLGTIGLLRGPVCLRDVLLKGQLVSRDRWQWRQSFQSDERIIEGERRSAWRCNI